MEFYKVKKKAALISLFVGLGMFFSKLTAYFLTSSAAIFSDAAESIVHVLATGMALYSIVLSSLPEDEDHPYGHGKIEFFSAGIEGVLILFAAIFIIYEASLDLIKGPEVSRLDIGAIIISIAGVVNLILGLYLIKKGKQTNSLTLIADGKHVLTDSYTSIGVLVGVLLVFFTNIKILDPIFAIFVAVNIIFTGYKLIRQSFGGLMNEVNKELLELLTSKFISIKKDYWIDMHELRFWESGEKVFIDFHLILPHYFTVKQSHTEENEIEAELKKDFPNSQLKIHFDFCVPELCSYCVHDCFERLEDKTKKFEWNSKKMTGKPIYELF